MVTIIQLPPQADPKKLTGNRRIKNLEEHLLAFLAIHNPNGYPKEKDQSELTEFIDLIIEISTRHVMSNVMLRDKAREIKRLAKGSFRHAHALDLIARIFGYRSYHDAFQLRDENNCVKNLKHGNVDLHLVFNTDVDYLDTLVKYNGVQNSEVPAGYIPAQRRSRSWDGIESRDLTKIVYQFAKDFRVGKLRTDQIPLRQLAAQRFFGLDNYLDLNRYVKRAEFPPFFNPINLKRNETRLSKVLSRSKECDLSISQIYKNLYPFCKDEFVAHQLQYELFELGQDIGNCSIEYWYRDLGACGVMVIPNSVRSQFIQKRTKAAVKAIAFITENDKIVQIIKLV